MTIFWQVLLDQVKAVTVAASFLFLAWLLAQWEHLLFSNRYMLSDVISTTHGVVAGVLYIYYTIVSVLELIKRSRQSV